MLLSFNHCAPFKCFGALREDSMEFVELLLLCVAVLLLIFKPEQEKLAWWLTVGGWFVVVFMYVGHVSTAILGSLNL